MIQNLLIPHLCLPIEGHTPQDCKNCSVSRAGLYENFVEFLKKTYSKDFFFKYRLFHEHEREDIISEFVMRVHKQADQCHGPAKFKAWASTIFNSVYVDHCRKKLGRKKISGKEDENSSGAAISTAQRNTIMSICTRKDITEQELEKQIEETYKSTLDNLSASEASSLIKNLQHDDRVEPFFELVSIEDLSWDLSQDLSDIPDGDTDSKLSSQLMVGALLKLIKDEKHKENCQILIDHYEWGKKGLNQEAMAKRYGISHDNFRTKISRARKHIKKALGMDNG